MGPNGPVALDMVSVNQAMIDYGVPEDERIEFSYTVRQVASMIFGFQAEESERKRKMKK